jgi:hypothetical protein
VSLQKNLWSPITLMPQIGQDLNQQCRFRSRVRLDPTEQKIGDNCYLPDQDQNQYRESAPNYEMTNENMENQENQESPEGNGNNDALSQGSNEDKDRFEFAGGDEWHAIVEYNHKKYEEDLKQNRIKDLDIKRRQKDDLEVQMRQKLLKQQQEKILNRDYDNMVDQHIIDMKDIEVMKAQIIKDKTFTLKSSRDVLLKNENKMKKEIVQNNKIFEKEHCNFSYKL